MNYKDYNDYELLSYVNDNDIDNAIIYEKYRPLIEKNARKLVNLSKYSGLDINDFIQEGFIGLNNAISTFNETKETSFYTYAKTLIERKQITALIASQRLKHRILNESLSLEGYDNDEDSVSLNDLIGDNKLNPENVLTDMEDINEVVEKINKELTDFEQAVFNLKITGLNYKEISELLQKDVKQIDNAIQRIKKKIRKISIVDK